MPVQTTDLFDATNANIGHLPNGAAVAGYMTAVGNDPSIEWNDAAFMAHPGAVRIAQLPIHDPATADVLDYETGAAQDSELVPWAKQAIIDFHTGVRPGQRSPAIYVQRSKVTHVVNVLIAGGITSGIGLGIADWNNNPTQAANEVANASGPFPVVWRQYANRGTFDAGKVSVPWLHTVSQSPIQNETVPNVIGKRAGDAHNLIVAAGLTPTALAGQKASEIVSQTVPAAGTSLRHGSDVQIVTDVHVVMAGVVITTSLNTFRVTSTDGGETWK